MITFPTGVAGGKRGPTSAPGQPTEARACRCGDRRLVADVECFWCGHLPDHVIRATWAQQALRCACGQADVALDYLTAHARETVTA